MIVTINGHEIDISKLDIIGPIYGDGQYDTMFNGMWSTMSDSHIPRNELSKVFNFDRRLDPGQMALAEYDESRIGSKA